MTARTIYVSLQGSGNSKNLRLRDSEGNNGINNITTLVNPGDTVLWVIDPTPPPGATQIGSVSNVYKKANGNSNNADLIIFTIDPVNGASDSGTITTTPQSPSATEQYSIDYLRVDGSPGSDDPQIRITTL